LLVDSRNKTKKQKPDHQDTQPDTLDPAGMNKFFKERLSEETACGHGEWQKCYEEYMSKQTKNKLSKKHYTSQKRRLTRYGKGMNSQQHGVMKNSRKPIRRSRKC
jgi:hypothetical protein